MHACMYALYIYRYIYIFVFMHDWMHISKYVIVHVNTSTHIFMVHRHKRPSQMRPHKCASTNEPRQLSPDICALSTNF